MSAPLLATKFYIPALPVEWITRTRLLMKMDDIFLPGKKLLLISAPAGYGKTSLVSEWSASAHKAIHPKTAWLSLDSEDNDLVHFLLYCIYAIQKFLPGVGEAERAALLAPQPPATEMVLTNLINQIAAQTEPLVLVLDDYHLIHQADIHEAVGFLLEHLPSQMRLAVASRTDPGLHLGRMRARRQLVELRAADLRFVSGEISAYLNQAEGLDLAAEDLTRLETRTEGWVAGLQLAALSMQGRENLSDFIREFSGCNVYILDYLTEEVLSRQSQDVRDFLMQTCILPRLCGPLCDCLTQRQDSPSMLAELARANLFVIALDDQQNWYRYHPLFADLLRAQLERLQPGRSQDLHRSASRWFAENEFPAEAIQHALAGKDAEAAAALVEACSMERLMQGEINTVMGWIHSLPPEVARWHPWLNIYDAWMQILSGHLEASENQLQKAVENLVLRKPAQDSGEEIDLFYGNIAAIRAYIASLRGDALQTTKYAHQALELLPENEERIRCVAAFTLGAVSLYKGDLAAACEALTAASQMARRSGNLHLGIPATCGLGGVQIIMGRLRLAAETLQTAQAMASGPNGLPTPLFGRVCTGWSEVHYLWNDLDQAERYARQGIELSRQWGNHEVLGRNYLALGRVLAAKRAYPEAETALETADQLARTHAVNPDMAAAIHAWRIRLWLAQPETGLEKAVGWMEKNAPRLEEDASLANELERLSIARILAAQKRADEALLLLERLCQGAEAGQRAGRVLEIRITQAALYWQQGKPAPALTALEKALALAQPEGSLRPFINEGEPMQRLLRLGCAHFDHRPALLAFTRQLLSAFGDASGAESLPPSAAVNRPDAGQFSGWIEPLSERELEVLRLVAEGCSNAEISTRLVIALSTTKRHLNHILGKLEASNRTQAVMKARESGLL
jgi:LuxR family transcriptional regulator, maltose regulon positive regulatory protein